jgi:hypothetical protein
MIFVDTTLLFSPIPHFPARRVPREVNLRLRIISLDLISKLRGGFELASSISLGMLTRWNLQIASLPVSEALNIWGHVFGIIHIGTCIGNRDLLRVRLLSFIAATAIACMPFLFFSVALIILYLVPQLLKVFPTLTRLPFLCISAKYASFEIS